MKNIQLKNYWQNTSWLPGYQHILYLMNFSEEDLNQMANWDNEELIAMKESEEQYNNIEKLKNQEQLKEFKKELDIDYIDERRLEYLYKKKEFLESRISEAREHDKEMRQRFYNPIFPLDWLRLVIMELWDLPELERELRKVTFEIRLVEYKDVIQKGQITLEMINKAKEYPFENLIQTNKAGFAKCLFHEDKHPSMYCKNNFAYCFACNKSADSIDIVMETKNLSFIEAVRILQ